MFTFTHLTQTFFVIAILQGRSKSLTHIDTLDPGMLVSRENSGDCRSEPDSTMQLAGGSQDRLAVPAMVAPIPSSSVTVSGAVTGATPIGSPAPTTGDSSPTDPAVRRRRLSNLYKVILTFCFFFVCCFSYFFIGLCRRVITFWLLIPLLVFFLLATRWDVSFC